MEDVFRAAEELYAREHIALNLTDRPIRVEEVGIIVLESQRSVYCQRPEVPAKMVMEEGSDRFILVPPEKSVIRSQRVV